MRNRKQLFYCLFFMAAMMFMALGFPSEAAEAAEASIVSVDRMAGQCTYSVLLDGQTEAFTLQVYNTDTGELAMEREQALTEEEILAGSYEGIFTLEELGNVYADYSVILVIKGEFVSAGNCDFSISDSKSSVEMTVKGSKSRAERTVKIDGVSESVLASGGSLMTILAWPSDSKQAEAAVIGEQRLVSGGSVTCPVDVSLAGQAYGTWKAKAVLQNGEEDAVTLAETEYEVMPKQESFRSRKSKALEKKKAFALDLKGLENVYGVKKVTFQIYNSSDKLAASVAGREKKNGHYYAEVKLKKLGYRLDQYTVKAVLTDLNGNDQTLGAEASADEQMKSGEFSITKKGNARCVFKIRKAYVPGNIRKVQFELYSVEDGSKKKLHTYSVKAVNGKNKFVFSTKHDETGEYFVKAYAVTAWKETILLDQKSYQLKKGDMGKNGWYYEKYNGETYKFYYVNNVKQTDLTDVLGIEPSNAAQGNKLYIELNRAACTVTIYLYNEETKKYDIPVKSCAVSVGRDTWSSSGSGGLSLNSSFTPLGDYSICTNGTAVKYTLKPMYEPNGSTVYARWCTHIVGNVYFHAIAVGSQSHYSLSSYTYNKLGSPASAGCIRMTVADAKWIYDYAPTGTKVKIVKGDSSKPGPLGKPKTIKTSGVSYDPTDPEVPDSRKKADYKAGRISGYMTKDGEKVGY